MGTKPYYAPHSLDIDITTHCNLRCSYCSHFSSEGDVNTDRSLEEWDRFFQECTSIGIMNITLSGGEAFYRKDIREIIQSIIHNRMRFSILSNGTLINDETAKFLKNTRRCNSIQVSIDGPEASHDLFRGNGSFNQALKGLEALVKNKVKATSRITLNKHNFRHLPETAKLLLEDIGLNNISTNSVSYFGLCRENNDSMALNAVEFGEAMLIIQELLKKYPGRINAMAGPQACAENWRQMEKAVSGDEEAAKATRCGYLGSCGCVWSKLSILADGTIVVCCQLATLKVGKINEDKLREVWLNSPVLKGMRKRVEIPLSKFDSCRECKYREFCRGGCPATAYTIFGNVNVPNLAIDSCYREFLKQGGVLPPEI